MSDPIRILFVPGPLEAGGERAEIRLLVRHLDPRRFRIDVVAREEGAPERTHGWLEALGVRVDRVPCGLSSEGTVRYLAGRLPAYDVVISCGDVAEVRPALERLHRRPPLIERGGLVPDAAAARMPGRNARAAGIPAMVDLAAFDPAHRARARAALGVAEGVPLIGWAGPPGPGTRAEDFLGAAAILRGVRPEARFLVVGGPGASLPDDAALRRGATVLGLDGAVILPGDRPDVPEPLPALDALVWLSRGEGLPRVVAEAGAAGLPVIATPGHGAQDGITDGETGLLVPHEDPSAVAAALLRLLDDPPLRRRLGGALRAVVRAAHSAEVLVPRWEALFERVVAEHRRPAPPPTLFRSFFQGGFECSTHRRAHDGRRLDMIAATAHDTHAAHDYAALAAEGLLTVRDGLRWHLIERQPGRYDWSSLRAQQRAARAQGTQVIWDLMHYGWPDDIDVWRPEFVDRFARFAAAAAREIGPATGGPAFYAPVNEISFLAWGGGDVAYLNPFARKRAQELKVQLARAALAAMRAIRAIDPAARFVHADPMINVVHDPSRPHEALLAEGYRGAQFDAWDMIAGASRPEIGGGPEWLDIVGVNYYSNNQWIHEGPFLDVGHPSYRPFRDLLAEVHARYGRPVFVAETGIEAERRPAWLAYVASEVRAARRRGVPVEGICLYPVMDHPGWDNDRYCPNGLLRFGPEPAQRTPDPALAAELRRQRRLPTG